VSQASALGGMAYLLGMLARSLGTKWLTMRDRLCRSRGSVAPAMLADLEQMPIGVAEERSYLPGVLDGWGEEGCSASREERIRRAAIRDTDDELRVDAIRVDELAMMSGTRKGIVGAGGTAATASRALLESEACLGGLSDGDCRPLTWPGTWRSLRPSAMYLRPRHSRDRS
jgi:hypothetical protein